MIAVEALKKRISEKGTLLIQNEEGSVSEAGFDWNSPATDEDLEQFEKSTGIALPDDYKAFLKISNGATLFKDVEYGQWGCQILALDQLIVATQDLRNYGQDLTEASIVFATWLGDGDTLLFDLRKYQNEGKNYIIDGDAGYNFEEWEYIKGNFGKWIDRLIVSQGAKYWRWY